jgi:hypothetical protein
MTVADLEERVLGESSYLRKSSDERLADVLAADSIDLINAITRRVEKMSSDLLFAWTISYLLDSGDVETLDYGTVTPIVPAVKWDQAASDPLADLAVAVNSIVANSGLLADVLVLGADVLPVFLGNAKVQDLLNKLNLTLGDIRPAKPQTPGTVHRANLPPESGLVQLCGACRWQLTKERSSRGRSSTTLASRLPL